MLRRATLLLGVAVLAACAASDNQTTTGASSLVHLDLALDVATVDSAPAPESASQQLEWDFSQSQASWRAGRDSNPEPADPKSGFRG